MKKSTMIACLILVGCLLSIVPASADSLLASLEKGDIQLESIGPINFGPEGILFIADPKAAIVYAVATDASSSVPSQREDVQDVDAKIAALLGIAAKEVIIQDLALNPISGAAYLSVSRGRGPEAEPVLVKIFVQGEITVADLEGVNFSKATLWAAPDKDRRGRDISQSTITEIAYIDGKVVVAGLSNQEFSSRLGVFPFPFTGKEYEAGLEIYHTSHGKWETHSPVRTFTPILFEEEPYILAAHTCTPLVRIPVANLVADEQKVVGDTIAELGNRNRPLDMLAYSKDDQDFLLIANSSRGVMKLAMEPMPGQEKLTERIPGTGGVPLETIESLEGTLQMEAWGDGQAVALRKNEDGKLDLTTVALP